MRLNSWHRAWLKELARAGVASDGDLLPQDAQVMAELAEGGSVREVAGH